MQRNSYQLKAGNLKNLKKTKSELPPPAANEVQIAIKAIGLNFADVFAIWGMYSATPKGVFIPGLEYSGIITAVGNEVSQHKPGDRVMGVTRFGAYTTHLNIGAEYAIALPAEWNFAEGAAYLVQVLTAYYGLVNLGNLQSDYTVLVHSAAGGVGIFAGRLAIALGAKRTIASVGNQDKVAFCKSEGYHDVIVRGKDFGAQLDELLQGEGINLIMECIGGEVLKAGYDRLAPEGRSVVYGQAHYAKPGDRPNYLSVIWKFLRRPKIDPQKMIELNKGILGFNLIYLYERSTLLHQLLADISQLNIGKPKVGHEFAFDDLPAAIRLFQTGKTMGKVIVEIQ